jgi:serine/threonine protein kinase
VNSRLTPRYLLCDAIGAGGMATVHLGRMRGAYGFSRTVAIKRLHPQFALNPRFVAMLTDEARLTVRIRHANVLSPLDVVLAESELFIVMDYVNGESLATLMGAANQPLTPALASAIIGQTLLGLHAAHEATAEDGTPLTIVHRDASPQNILVGEDGVARILDFGIAKATARTQITEDGKLKGKIGYFAPEQLDPGSTVDRRADLFAVGVVLWEALTGCSLFAADSLQESASRVLEGEIPLPSTMNAAVSPALDALVLRALARDPSDRFPDALTMASALQEAAAPAAPLEVSQWVQRWVGTELARKADLVRRIESLPFDADDTTKPSEGRPTSGPARVLASTSRRMLAGAGALAAVALAAIVFNIVSPPRSRPGGTAEPTLPPTAHPALGSPLPTEIRQTTTPSPVSPQPSLLPSRVAAHEEEYGRALNQPPRSSPTARTRRTVESNVAASTSAAIPPLVPTKAPAAGEPSARAGESAPDADVAAPPALETSPRPAPSSAAPRDVDDPVLLRRKRK